jgi:hypothetical protein
MIKTFQIVIVVFSLLYLAFLASPANAQITGFLSGWYTSGNYTVCEYQTERGVYAKMIEVTQVCAETVEIPSMEVL